MSKKKVCGDLKNRIENYLDYIWREEQIENEEEEFTAINKLSSILKEELLIYSNEHIIKSIPIFSKNFSSQFLKKISSEFKLVRKVPQEIIYQV